MEHENDDLVVDDDDDDENYFSRLNDVQMDRSFATLTADLLQEACSRDATE